MGSTCIKYSPQPPDDDIVLNESPVSSPYSSPRQPDHVWEYASSTAQEHIFSHRDQHLANQIKGVVVIPKKDADLSLLIQGIRKACQGEASIKYIVQKPPLRLRNRPKHVRFELPDY